MNTQKKMINQTAIVLIVLGAGLLCLNASATDPPPCPPCWSNWPDCDVWDCNAGEDCCDTANCETCIDNTCKVCSGDPNQVCCDGSCCDTSINCQTCVEGNCVSCDGDPDLLCCDHITCYDPNDLQCCGYGDGTTCKNDCELCCEDKCCDLTNCEICKNGNCLRAIPTNMRQTYVEDQGGGVLYFEYVWESTTGDINDLFNCTVGERVDYPGSDDPYQWPLPWDNVKTPNPTVLYVSAIWGEATDTHSPAYVHSPYQNAGFSAEQIYWYHCGPSCCMEENEYETLLDIGPIMRWITGEDDIWRYSIMKSGAYAEFFLFN